MITVRRDLKENRSAATNSSGKRRGSLEQRGRWGMADPSGSQTKVIVVPRSLEGFFYERLSRQFAHRGDVRVVVDRRNGDRRLTRRSSGQSLPADRRRGQRRRERLIWDLSEMPPSLS
jgi:hypothetical protein